MQYNCYHGSRLMILGNQKLSGKSENFTEWNPGAQFSSENGYFVETRKSPSKLEREPFLECTISHKN